MTNGLEDLENINKYVAELNEQIKREAQDKLKPALTKAIKYFFENVNGVEKIRWTQYTPYFNDGDECVFYVHDLMLRYEDEALNEEHEEYEGYCSVYSLDDEAIGVSPEAIKIFKNLEEALMQNSELLKLAFGDHAEITVDKEGNVEVEEYVHD